MTPYEEYKVYGPYTRKDGRKHVCLVGALGRKTVSYPKYLMEVSLGRYLLPNEEIHHIDGDFSNDVLSNLVVVDGTVHRSEHTLLPESIMVKCINCNKPFSLDREHQSRRSSDRKRGKAGPFCSRQCSGVYGTSIQYGNTE